MSTEHPADQPDSSSSPDQAEELARRLRAAPAEDLVADLLATLVSTAQVKLGRRDARLFIDLSAGVAEHAAPYLSDDLRRRVAATLGQLRLAQVSAEGETTGEPEANDLASIPEPPPVQDPAPAPTPPAPPAGS